MVKAELGYNPYLQQTDIKFNGQAPRINSLVEKYQDKKLQTWIRKIPEIFRDEMNGYGFDLEFTGTRLDFEELGKAFAAAGVGDDSVHLFHKSILNERLQKLTDIDALLNWLGEHPNRRYDYAKVREENKELFEGDYQYIMLHGRAADLSVFDKLHISVENMADVNEMQGTNLYNIPILYVIDAESLQSLKKDLHILRKRPDIAPDQIFFLIDPKLSEEKVVRIIIDLGMQNPQVVKSVDAPEIMRYFELYPYTDYIRDVVALFRKNIEAIGDVLKEENRQSEIANREIHREIDALDTTIGNLKEALDKFVNPEFKDYYPAFSMIRSALIANISDWKNRKTKITREEEAVIEAKAFDEALDSFYGQFLRETWDTLNSSIESIKNDTRSWYESAGVDTVFDAGDIPVQDLVYNRIPSIEKELLEIRQEAYVTPKEDFLGMLFMQNADKKKAEPVLEKTYYYQNWREHAVAVAEPLAKEMIEKCGSILEAFFADISAAYQAHLRELIRQYEEEKNKVSARLSEDEQLLQADNDWLVAFTDAVKGIARD